jgi:uncharacterized protein YdhG (YjbR/CyaY superfamily)
MPAATQKSTKAATTTRKTSKVWTDEERAAMQTAARERKVASRRDPAAARADGERDVLAKIAEMSAADRVMAERIHALVSAAAPSLVPRTFYGMPAYAREGGKVLCFFKPASTYKERYATFGFQDNAHLDEGTFWPTSWALTTLTPAVEEQIAALVKKAAS